MKHLYRITLLFLMLTIFFSGCTLHFKASDLEINSETTRNNPDGTNDIARTFVLTSIDFAKN